MNPATLTPSTALDEALQDAIDARETVQIAYAKPNEKAVERIVSPSEIWEAKDSALILSAFDHSRDEPRSFRLDRIESVSEPSESVEFVEMPTRD